MDRRRFIISGASLIGTLGAARLLWPAGFANTPFDLTPQLKKKEGLIISTSSAGLPKETEIGFQRFSEPIDGFIGIFDLQSRTLKNIPVPLLGHGFSFTQQNGRHLAVTCQKWGTKAIVVDLDSRELVKEISAPKGYVFFGHSCFINQGAHLVVSSQAADVYGSLLVYDSKDWTLLREIRLPMAIHEVITINSGGKESLLAAFSHHRMDPSADHGQYKPHGPGFLQEVDFTTGALGRSVPVVEAAHILPLQHDSYLVGGFISKHAPLALSLVNLNSRQRTDVTKALGFSQAIGAGEALSLAKMDNENLVITEPDSKAILIWNIHNNSVSSIAAPDKPHGVLGFNDCSFIVSHVSGDLIEYQSNSKTGEIKRGEVLASEAFANGKHLYLRTSTPG